MITLALNERAEFFDWSTTKPIVDDDEFKYLVF